MNPQSAFMVAACIGSPLNACRDVYAVTHQVIALHDHVAEMNTYAQR